MATQSNAKILNREKYLQLARTQGVDKALTTLHRDTTGWEYITFETDKGYQPGVFEELKTVRDFSRELWEMALRNELKP
ncbi:MAG: hypothetical protein NDJ89_14775 [Oligoflexia bacterium]|nr:hypothetical protein [Oligoflexia bacterium]